VIIDLDGAGLEERIAAAFARAATEIEVSRRPFDAGDAPAPAGRGVRLSSPKPPGAERRPASELDARPPSDGSRRGHRLTAAAAVVIALAMGAAAFRHAGSSEAGTGPGSGRSSLRTVERTGTVDPMLVDYVFPVDGDEWAAALDRFDGGAARAVFDATGECLRDHPQARGWILLEATKDATNMLREWLPSLRAVSEGQMHAATVPGPEREAALACAEEQDTPWAGWQRDAVELRSLEHLRPALARVQKTTRWTEARTCLVEAGFPPDPSVARRSIPESSMQENSALQGRSPLEVFVYLYSITLVPDSPGPEDFVRCTAPYFAEVERVLQKPRAAFVKEHREELLELQRRFEAFAGPGD